MNKMPHMNNNQSKSKYLIPAISMKDKLNAQLQKIAMSSYMKWWQTNYRSLELQIDNTDWDKTQLVYTDYENIYSYICLSWARPENFIDNLSCINFYPDKKTIFATALLKALSHAIYKLNVPKIEWRVTVGNPIEKAYDRICSRYGGRIVGIQKNHVMVDNRYYDSKLYEWINYKYVCNGCGYTIKNIREDEVVVKHCNKCHGEMIYKNPFNFGG